MTDVSQRPDGHRYTVGAAIMALVILACAGQDVDTGSGVRSDSAGVTLIEYPALPSATSGALALHPEPAIVLGGSESDDQLFNVAGAVRLTDGRIVVANAGSSQLRFYDESGEFLGASGALGEGPGEFRALAWIDLLPGDSIVTWDSQLLRLQVFAPDGQFVRGEPTLPDQAGFFPSRPVGVLQNGTLVVVQANIPDPSDEGLQRGIMRVMMRGYEAVSWDSVVTVGGDEQFIARSKVGFTMAAYPFGAFSDVAAGHNRIAVIDSHQFGLLLFDSTGRAIARLRITEQPLQVTTGILEAYVESILKQWPPNQPDAARAAFRRSMLDGPHGDVLPFLTKVEVDRVGRSWLWLSETSGSDGVHFVVVGADGDYLGRVMLPSGMKHGSHPSLAPVLDIGSDYVVGVWQDELDVETVRLFRLSPEVRGS